MTDILMSKKCAVCGDVGVGVNFDAMTCGSCKAFFRRNALKNQEVNCHFDEKCEINAITRRFCSKCRLNKCFAVGMKKESILSVEEKQKRRFRTKKNNIEMKSSESAVISDSTTGKAFEPIDTNVDNLTEFLEQVLEDNSISEEKLKEQIMEIESSVTYNVNTNEISNEKPIDLESTAMSIMPVIRPISDYNNNFNELEFNRLTELLNATNIIKMSFSGQKIVAQNNEYGLCAMYDCFEQMFTKLVAMSKLITVFNKMCEQDQIALFKYGSIQIMAMRSVIGYDCQTERLTLPDEETHSLVVVKFDSHNDDSLRVGHANQTYFRVIGREWDSDSVILDLMTAIVLFDPNRPKLIHRQSIKLQQHVYMYLLQRYLLLKYRSESEAKSKFLRLMRTLKYLQNLYTKLIALYNRNSVMITCGAQNSVMIEIFGYDL